MRTSFEDRYFNLNRIALLATGLWPHQQSNFVHFQLVIIVGVLTSFIAFQCSRLMFVEHSFDFTIKMLSASSIFIFFITKYISFWVNNETIKGLLERLEYVYNGLQDRNEIAIYDKYGIIGKRFTIGIILIEVIVAFCTIVVQCWPYIFDMIMSKNESYTRHLIIIITKYYDIQEKYYYLVLLHLNIAVAVGSSIFLAIGAIMLSSVIHICGMFRIASYRLERAMAINSLQTNKMKNKNVIHKKIIYAVDIHRKAMEFIEYFAYNFEKSFFTLTSITVVCVSLNLYRVSQIHSFMKELEESLAHFAIVIILLVYLFLVNNAGQEITNFNNHVFLTAYNIPWYLAPLHIQKMILFLLQRNNKVFALNIGGIFIASLECFASLASASVSYFTVMYSAH